MSKTVIRMSRFKSDSQAPTYRIPSACHGEQHGHHSKLNQNGIFPFYFERSAHFFSSKITGQAFRQSVSATALDSRKHKLLPQESKEGKLSYKSFETISSAPPATVGEIQSYRVSPTPDSTSPQNLLSKSRKKCGQFSISLVRTFRRLPIPAKPNQDIMMKKQNK